MKHELEGSIRGKISVSVSSWETPGGSDKRGGMRLSLFFSPVRPLTIIAPLALSSNWECGDNNQFLLMFHRHYHCSQGKTHKRRIWKALFKQLVFVIHPYLSPPFLPLLFCNHSACQFRNWYLLSSMMSMWVTVGCNHVSFEAV